MLSAFCFRFQLVCFQPVSTLAQIPSFSVSKCRFQPVFRNRLCFLPLSGPFVFRFRLWAQNTTGAPDGSNRCRFFPSSRAWALVLDPSQGPRSEDLEICRNPSLARPGPAFRFQPVFNTFSNRFLRRICFGQPCAPRHPRTVT